MSLSIDPCPACDGSMTAHVPEEDGEPDALHECDECDAVVNVDDACTCTGCVSFRELADEELVRLMPYLCGECYTPRLCAAIASCARGKA